jgi:hypothetical protein
MTHPVMRPLMSEIGPLLELAEVVEFAEQSLWVLVFDDGTWVEVELDAQQQRVLFTNEAGELPADRAEAVCRTLLAASLLWRQTGGLHYALDGHTVVQMLELPLAQLDLSTMATVLRNLQAGAQRWRAILAAPAAEPGAIAPISYTSGALRV